MATAEQELLRIKLAEQGLDLDREVRRRRKNGEAWQTIAYFIKDTTGRTLTAETVRRWYSRET